MNLPFILDVGLGLLFIYLILSLLASEFQELLATILQWRAKHLREAIEILLAGESKPPLGASSPESQVIRTEITQARELVTKLYHHPLLKSLNQEAKGLVGKLGQIVSQLTGLVKVFEGQSSGPSYVPSETFAATLVSTLRLDELVQKLSEIKLYQLIQDRLLGTIEELVADLRNSKGNSRLLQRELQVLSSELEGIYQDFANQQLPLAHSLRRSEACMKRFITATEVTLSDNDIIYHKFLKRLKTLDQDLPSLIQEAVPRITEAIAELKTLHWVTQQNPEGGDPRLVMARLRDDGERLRFQQGYPLLQAMNQSLKSTGVAQLNYQQILAVTPGHVLDSLETLAKSVQERTATDVSQLLLGLQRELAIWYDRSMDRASGVYRRNAKGVALIIGCLIAVLTNTDTLHIMQRLAKEPTLRQTYAEAAAALVKQNPEAIACFQATRDPKEQANCLQSGGISASAADLSNALDQSTDLPLGWTQNNWQEQWQPRRRGVLTSGFLLLVGWLTSGVAIAMGAPFWFSLIQKVINARNTGDRPPTAVERSTLPRSYDV